LAHHLDEHCIVVFGAVFGQHFREPHFGRVELRARVKAVVIQLVVVKGFNERTHFIELPNLFLKRDAVNVVRKTNVVQRLLVKGKRVALVRQFGQRVHHVFVPQQPHDGAVRLVHHRGMVAQIARRVYQFLDNGFAVFVVGLRLENGLNERVVVGPRGVVVVENSAYDGNFAKVALNEPGHVLVQGGVG